MIPIFDFSIDSFVFAVNFLLVQNQQTEIIDVNCTAPYSKMQQANNPTHIYNL